MSFIALFVLLICNIQLDTEAIVKYVLISSIVSITYMIHMYCNSSIFWVFELDTADILFTFISILNAFFSLIKKRLAKHETESIKNDDTPLLKTYVIMPKHGYFGYYS